jgi:hypothetical protein
MAAHHHMLGSPAYRVLRLTAHRIIARLEIELAHHGGTDNGRLPLWARRDNDGAEGRALVRRELVRATHRSLSIFPEFTFIQRADSVLRRAERD